jgi:hypothetical protein
MINSKRRGNKQSLPHHGAQEGLKERAGSSTTPWRECLSLLAGPGDSIDTTESRRAADLTGVAVNFSWQITAS